jgi:hypothetical protein
MLQVLLRFMHEIERNAQACCTLMGISLSLRVYPQTVLESHWVAIQLITLI